MKQIIFIIGMLNSLFFGAEAQFIPDSTKGIIHLYDSLILTIDKNKALLEKSITGEEGLLKHYEGIAYIKESNNKLLKLELFFDDKSGEKVTIYLHKNRIIVISIGEISYYIINDDCFAKEHDPALYCNKLLEKLQDFKSIVKNMLILFSYEE